MSLKILLVVQYFEPAWGYGGPPRLVSELSHLFAARGHHVTVCTTDAFEETARLPPGRAEVGGVEVHRFANLSNRLAYHLKIFAPLGMRDWLNEHVPRFDVVHLFDARAAGNAWAAEAAIAASVPFFLSVWGSLPRGTGWRAAIKRVYDIRYLSRQLSSAAALLAQNEHERQLYLAEGASAPVELWPLAVDVSSLGTPRSPGSFRAAYGIDADERVVLFVGRLSEHKGLEALIRAFATARRRVDRARLVIVGRDDGYLGRLRALVHELGLDGAVTLPGALYGAEVLPAYIDCDLFAILPSHFEETSLAALTASAFGRAVLINDRCEVPWLAEYEAGVSVVGDERAGEVMAELLADPVRLARLGENGRRLVAEHFTWDRVVEQLEGLYLAADAARRTGARSIS